jgi:hypothetical protein
VDVQQLPFSPAKTRLAPTILVLVERLAPDALAYVNAPLGRALVARLISVVQRRKHAREQEQAHNESRDTYEQFPHHATPPMAA